MVEPNWPRPHSGPDNQGCGWGPVLRTSIIITSPVHAWRTSSVQSSPSYLDSGGRDSSLPRDILFHLHRGWSQWLGGRPWADLPLSLLDLWNWWIIYICLICIFRKSSAHTDLYTSRCGIIWQMIIKQALNICLYQWKHF